MQDDFDFADDTLPGCTSGMRKSSQKLAANRNRVVEDFTCKGCGELCPANPMKRGWVLVDNGDERTARWMCQECLGMEEEDV